jgi:hypothetical protein
MCLNLNYALKISFDLKCVCVQASEDYNDVKKQMRFEKYVKKAACGYRKTE